MKKKVHKLKLKHRLINNNVPCDGEKSAYLNYSVWEDTNQERL